MTKQKIYLSLSLPKTGTTFLEKYLANIPGYVFPVIKEPSYFIDRAVLSKSKYINSSLVKGNHNKGLDWYRDLYLNSGENTLFDMSTQYWMYKSDVLSKAVESGFEVHCLGIYREPKNQLLSYITHLRRGYIGEVPLNDICEDDLEFRSYLMSMMKWRESFEKFSAENSAINCHLFDFKLLMENPHQELSKVFRDLPYSEKVSSGKKINAMSHPKIPYLNNLIFSEGLKRAGRLLPGSLYNMAVSARKTVVKLNLKEGEGKLYERDKSYIDTNF